MKAYRINGYTVQLTDEEADKVGLLGQHVPEHDAAMPQKGTIMKGTQLHPKLAAAGISDEVARKRPYVPFTTVTPVKKAFEKWPRALRSEMTRRANLALGLDDPGGLIMVRTPPPGIQAPRLSARLRPNGETDDLPKYLIPPNPKVDDPWKPHDHAVAYADDARDDDGNTKLDRHLRRWYHGEGGKWGRRPKVLTSTPADVSGEHQHVGRQKDDANGHGKRIDMHPMAADRLKDAEVVYFVLEGEIKADSVLTRIIERGDAATVFSVPSVTLWDAPELSRFASKRLQRKLVVIVCDSDWADEGKDVELHAMTARSFLRNRGIAACVAAPPSKDGGKVGVDDFLASGGELHELIVLDRQTTWEGDPFAELARDRPGWRDQRVTRFLEITECLQSVASRDGEIRKSQKSLARIMGTSRPRVKAGLEDLIEDGLLATTSASGTVEERYQPFKQTDKQKRRGQFIRGPQWEHEIPTFVLDPGYRATDRLVTLGRYLHERGHKNLAQ